MLQKVCISVNPSMVTNNEFYLSRMMATLSFAGRGYLVWNSYPFVSALTERKEKKTFTKERRKAYLMQGWIRLEWRTKEIICLNGNLGKAQPSTKAS